MAEKRNPTKAISPNVWSTEKAKENKATGVTKPISTEINRTKAAIKDTRSFTERQEDRKPGAFVSGVNRGSDTMFGANRIDTGAVERQRVAQLHAANPKTFQAGEATGAILSSLLPFGGGEALAARGLAKVAPKLTGLGMSLAKGAVGGAAVQGVSDIAQGKTAQETLKDVAIGTALGAGAELGLSALGKAIRSIKTGAKAADVVADIAKNAPETKVSIQQELGLQEGSTWDDIQRKLDEEEAVEALYQKYAEYEPTQKESITIPVKRKPSEIPDEVQRFDEPGKSATVDKPQGLYTTPSDVVSPHAELGGEKNTYRVNKDSNILTLETGTFKTNRGNVSESAGVATARKLLGDEEVTRLFSLSKPELISELKVKYPNVNWERYYDSQDAVEGLAGIVAKENGYDAIWAVDKDPEFNEYVALTENAFVKETPTATPQPDIERELFPSVMRQPAPSPKLPEPALKTAYERANAPRQAITPELPVNAAQGEITPMVAQQAQAPKERFSNLDMNLPKAQSVELKMPKPEVQGPPVPREGGASIVFGAKPEKKSFTRKVEEFRNAFEDDGLDFARLEKRVKGKVQSAEKSIYKTYRLYKGAPEEAYKIVKKQLAPIVDDAKAAGFSEEELAQYALMKHAEDVNAAGMESGFGDAEIRATLDKYSSTPLEAARQRLVKLSDELIENLKNDGVISQDQVDEMRKKWPNYMPLFRHFDDEKVDMAHGIGQAFSNVVSPIKSLKGSTRDVINPLESMVKNIYSSVDAGARNRVGLQLHELAQGNPTINGVPLIRKLEPGETVGRKNVVNVRVGGEKVAYEVEPEVFKVFNNLDKESGEYVVNLLSKSASVLRAGATLTPEFAIRNPFRDILNAFVTSKSGFNPFTDFPAGLAATIESKMGKSTTGNLYDSWIKEGGGYGNIISMDREAHAKTLKEALKTPIQGKFVNVVNPKAWLSLMREISDVTESATKVGEYRAALRQGQTPQEAAYRARDLMDFARAGHSVRQWNRMTAFMNANIQGKSKLVRAIADNPVGTSARIISSMVLPTMAVVAFREQYANEEQKQTIKDAPDWLKNSFWLIPVPGTDMVARFPKPFDISVAANTTERFMDYASERDPEAFKGFLSSTIKGQSIPMMMTGIVPIAEGIANYSAFREGPIIPRSEQNRSKKYQFDSKTSELAKAAASLWPNEESNFASPRVMDYVIRSSTGGLGSYALDASDALYNVVTGSQKPPKPTPTLEQRPVIKAFMVNPRTSGKSVDFVYDTASKLTAKKADAKVGGEALTASLDKARNLANGYKDELSDISKEIKLIEESKDFTPDQKRDKIAVLIKQRTDTARKAKETLQPLLK